MKESEEGPIIVTRNGKPVPGPKGYDKAGAEDHYRKGLNYFLAEDLQGAIREWQETLRLDPSTRRQRGISRRRAACW